MSAGGALLRLVAYAEHEPAVNMALDEALLDVAEDLVLRFYGWRPHALSLGWFQSPDHPAARAAATTGLPLVRRLTGGGAIVHAHELTYALAGPDGSVPFDGAVDRSYRRVHEAIARVLCRHGAPVTFADDAPRALAHAERPFSCFARTTRLDLVASGGKIVGSAKRRRGGRALQHGSILLGAHPMQPGTTSLELLTQQPADPAALAAEIAAELASTFELAAASAAFTSEEREHARRREAAFRLEVPRGKAHPARS